MTQDGTSQFTREDELRILALRVASGDRMRALDKDGNPVPVDVVAEAQSFYDWLTGGAG